MVNPIIKWVIIIACALFGLHHLFFAFKNNNSEKQEFKLRHLFQNIPLKNASRTQLIIEGVFGILIGILAYFYIG